MTTMKSFLAVHKILSQTTSNHSRKKKKKKKKALSASLWQPTGERFIEQVAQRQITISKPLSYTRS